jgi:hypothetical protein
MFCVACTSPKLTCCKQSFFYGLTKDEFDEVCKGLAIKAHIDNLVLFVSKKYTIDYPGHLVGWRYHTLEPNALIYFDVFRLNTDGTKWMLVNKTYLSQTEKGTWTYWQFNNPVKVG